MSQRDASAEIEKSLTLARKVAHAMGMGGVDVWPIPESQGHESLRAILAWPIRSFHGAEEHAVLHLPRNALKHRALLLASVSHAVAHRLCGMPPQSRRGLKPVQQALLGVLEDARVEYLMAESWPGLRRWWQPFLAQSVAERGQSFDDLLARLAWVLSAPVRHQDPHPWIRKVRDMVFDAQGGLLLREPQALREVASLLGNDIGQMRLPFNARTYQVAAAYRDDNSVLWLADEDLDRAAEAPLLEGAHDSRTNTNTDNDTELPPPPFAEEGVAEQDTSGLPEETWYPEWDQRIRRLRPDWCRVLEEDVPMVRGQGAEPREARRVDRWLQSLQRTQVSRGVRQNEGDDLHPVAMIDHVIARRMGAPSDGRVFRGAGQRPANMNVLLLVDASASAWPSSSHWQQHAWAVAVALERLGCQVAVWRFGSDGRRHVRVQVLKPWGQRATATAPACSEVMGSTRIGPVLRHATQACQQVMGKGVSTEWHVAVISDGQWHDVDVHEAGYLEADVSHAARHMQASGGRLHLLASTADRHALPAGSWTRRHTLPVRGAQWARTLVQAMRR